MNDEFLMKNDLFKGTIKLRFHRINEKGNTLIELILVLVILSILAVIAMPRMVDIEENASIIVLQKAVSELNSRETLVWHKIKLSESGWVNDEALFSQNNYDLGLDYHWKSKAEIDGGKLYFKDEMIKLDRMPSTAISPGHWRLVIEN